MIRIRLFLCLLMLSTLVLASCGDDDDPPTGGERMHVQASIELQDEDADLYVGDVLVFHYAVTKEDDAAFTFEFEDSCLVGYEIVKHGEIVARYPAACAPPGRTFTFDNPGVYSFVLGLSTIDELPNVEWNLPGNTLPPGTYELRAGLLGHKTEIPWAEIELIVREYP